MSAYGTRWWQWRKRRRYAESDAALKAAYMPGISDIIFKPSPITKHLKGKR